MINEEQLEQQIYLFSKLCLTINFLLKTQIDKRSWYIFITQLNKNIQEIMLRLLDWSLVGSFYRQFP